MAFNKAKALQEAEKFVVQGKTAQAIKQYLVILEKDPSDVNLLNSIGDLYVREKNIGEALKQFQKLGDAYIQEGFTVKAIAIFKKISKLDPNAVDPLLKLAELYQIQGLSREAREQYFQAIEFYKKKNQIDKALEVLRKVVQLDPENAAARTRLALFCEQVGKKDEAAQAYVEGAEYALRRGDTAAAEPALKKALGLNAKNLQANLLQARLALAQHKPEEVERLLASIPELKADPAGKKLLLDAYLEGHKLEEAESLVVEVYRANPEDFTPLASFSEQCLEKQGMDAAFKPLAAVADELIERKETGPLMESLRRIWTKSPRHIPTLELIYRVCDRTADEFTLPEVLEALGHAQVQAGDLAEAEKAYQRLVDREPENEHYKGLLKQVLQKQGKEVVQVRPAELSESEIALTPEAEVVSAPAAEDAEQAAMVKEALDNSDLFARYNLVDKAVAELEKVLAVYPDQIDVHKRILEICRKGAPGRAAQAAAALARIFAARGDMASSKRYEQIAAQQGAGVAFEEVPLEVPSPEPAAQEFNLSGGIPVEPAEAPAPPFPQPPAEPPQFDLTAELPGAAPVPAAAEPQEIDLSGDWEATVAPVAETQAPTEGPPFNYEEAKVEITFYLENNFADEARKAVEELERKFPGNEQVSALRRQVEAHGEGAVVPEAAPEPEPAVTAEPPSPEGTGEWEPPSSFAGAEAPPEAPPVPSAEQLEPPPPPHGGAEGWELPSSFAGAEAPPEAPPMPSAEQLEPPTPVPTGPAPPTPVPTGPAPPPPPAAEAPSAAGGADLLGDLVGDLASSLDGLAVPAQQQAPSQAAGTPAAVSPLSGLLDELREPAAEAGAQKDDAETHYNLGVAFREMGLLDEAIGEFQKVVKGTGKGSFPPNFLQACSLLAVCFMDKKMPAVAVKWYLRALEMPGLEEEATLALQYDLGAAYEQAGDTRTALEKFTEVYSQNIDFRDVAEKIRVLQQKAT